MKESDLLAHIAARSADLPARFPHVLVGPGDDCAVVRTPAGDQLLLTTDHLVEGRHYPPNTPVDLIARKAVARSVSDIAAMGGAPAWSLATACLPPHYPHADTLFAAMKKWAEHWSCPLVGGDIATFNDDASPLVLTLTVAGHLTTAAAQQWIDHSTRRPITVPVASIRPLLRSGARPGDPVLVTGSLGGSVRSGRHLHFEPKLKEGQLAAWQDAGVNAMIDISDGLGRDAGRIARASGVVIELLAAQIPVSPDAGAWQSAVRDGEDYELLMCGSDRCFPSSHRIGHVRECKPSEPPAVWVTDPTGDRHEVSDWGWDHE